jgi:hypothetical protein
MCGIAVRAVAKAADRIDCAAWSVAIFRSYPCLALRRGYGMRLAFYPNGPLVLLHQESVVA